MKAETLPKDQQIQKFSYDELFRQSQEEEAPQKEYPDKELQCFGRLSPALKACFELLYIIEGQPFGYFFKYPVNPYALGLSDYWETIRKPMDLTTIKLKFISGIYSKIDQFDSDIKLMFNNARVYNHHHDTLVTQIASLLDFYQREFQIINDKILNGDLSENIKAKLHRKDPLISRLSEAQLKNIFSPQRRERLGKLLEFMQDHNRNKIKNMLMKRYPQLIIHTVNKRNALFLSEMTHEQVWDILKQCKNMGEQDFDLAQLSKVGQEAPDMEGYNQYHFRQQSDKESSFEVEDESEAND